MSEEKAKQLHVIIFCGPNGSGKTSLINEVKREGLTTVGGVYPMPARFINPDQIAKDLKGEYRSQDARDRAAFHESLKQRAEAIQSKDPFAYETVMSHPSRINEMLRLKEQGYHVLLTFITTDSPDKNVARVTYRYQSGSTTGHYVPPDRVRERYERTLRLLPKAAEIADVVFVYDNSADFASARLQAVIERGHSFKVDAHAKDWVRDRLVKPLQEREQQLNGIIEAIEAEDYAGAAADELRGEYQGIVMMVAPYYLVLVDEKAKAATVHDRLMLDMAPERNKGAIPVYAVGERLVIRYALDQAPLIERLGTAN